MTAMNYKLMNTIRFKRVYNWSVHYSNSVEQKFTEKYKLAKFNSFLIRNKTQIRVNDNVLYKRVTIKLYGKGINVRDEVLGEEIKTKQQFLLREGQFLFSRIDARNGAFGLATPEVDNAIITNDFPAFDIDSTQITPQFLEIITGSKPFYDFFQNLSSGTTGRQRSSEKDFLNFQIPLPTISIQNQLVNQYNQKLSQAQEAENQAYDLEKGIERYLLKELGIEAPKPVEKKQGLQFVRLKELSRWDYDFLANDEDNIFSIIHKSKYESKRIGEVYNFITRSWSSKKHKEDTFQYVEIGSVDSFLGITEATEVQTKKAPSRATQIIKKDDLILGLTRPNLKKFTIVNEKYDGNICSSGFQVIAPSSAYNLEFLLEFLKSEIGVKQVSYFMAGALYPAITTKQLKDLQIPLPPKEIQEKIVTQITTQKEEIKSLRQQVEKLRKQAKEEFENEIFI